MCGQVQVFDVPLGAASCRHQVKSICRVVLTGTPPQSNLREVWALLHFLMPDVFTAETAERCVHVLFACGRKGACFMCLCCRSLFLSLNLSGIRQLVLVVVGVVVVQSAACYPLGIYQR